MTKANVKNLFPWREENRVELLLDGECYFPEIWAAIDAAQDYIFIELYLVESGQAADQLLQVLRNAVQRGVQVFLLLDDYGSMALNEDDRQKLQHEQIHLVYYNPLSTYSSLRNIYRILWHKIGYDLHRDHRKLIVVDGSVAFVGGLGITDEFYSPSNPEFCWRENVVKIEGPVVVDWHCLFKQAWDRFASMPVSLPIPKPAPHKDGQDARVAFSEGTRRNDIQRQLLKRIIKAKHHIWLCTAYFLPSWRFLRRLRRAARKGVDVRLLLPGPHTDHPIVRHAGRRHYNRLLRYGVRIFEYQPRVLHAKVLTCDNWVSLGSNNFDHWGLTWNLEANLEVEDPAFTETIRQMFENDFAESVEITLEGWRQRAWYQRLPESVWGRAEKIVTKVTSRLNRHR